MPQFTYTGDAGRYYTDLVGGLEPEVGADYELEADPDDGRWCLATDPDALARGVAAIELAKTEADALAAEQLAELDEPPVGEPDDPSAPDVDDAETTTTDTGGK